MVMTNDSVSGSSWRITTI